MKKNTPATEAAKPASSVKNAKKTSAKKSEEPTKPEKSALASVIMPASLNIRSYQVGFGDCYLLTFNYPEAANADDRMRHILIDFGSTALPPGTPPDQMMRVAQDIKQQCEGKLHVVVATHRHKDHISGFTTQEDGSGTGDIIARLKPEAVIQPWTEDPEAFDPVINSPKAKMGESKTPMGDNAPNLHQMQAMHVSSLMNMHTVSEAMLAEVRHISDERVLKQPLGAGLAEKIRFLADDNALPNKSAVENLQRMGKNHYVSHGSQLNLSKLLPGIGISVLGPPTLEQHEAIKKQRSADKNEFWMLRAAAQKFWGQQAATGKMLDESTSDEKFTSDEDELFPNADTFSKIIPSHNRWFVRQLRAMRGEQMLGLVRILDKAMNNTSVILLFDVGGKKLLFSGDAQIENWEYALSLDEDVAQLKDVEVYKVGHHGSRNATPKTLWKTFEHKSEKAAAGKTRLKTLVSTMEGKHGSRANHSEVPRQTLVAALNQSSEYHTTETAAREGKLFEDIEITFP
jgi:hypothetical protein